FLTMSAGLLARASRKKSLQCGTTRDRSERPEGWWIAGIACSQPTVGLEIQRRMAMTDLIERLRGYAKAEDLHPDERATLLEAAAALEAAREDADKVISRIEQYANEQERDPIVVPPSRLRAWAS